MQAEEGERSVVAVGSASQQNHLACSDRPKGVLHGKRFQQRNTETILGSEHTTQDRAVLGPTRIKAVTRGMGLVEPSDVTPHAIHGQDAMLPSRPHWWTGHATAPPAARAWHFRGPTCRWKKHTVSFDKNTPEIGFNPSAPLLFPLPAPFPSRPAHSRTAGEPKPSAVRP